MVNFEQLRTLDVSAVIKSADSWGKIYDRLGEAGRVFEDDVTKPLGSGEWEGDSGKAAKKFCDEIRVDVTAVAKQVKNLRSYLDDKVDGGSTEESLKRCQDKVLDLQAEALSKG